MTYDPCSYQWNDLREGKDHAAGSFDVPVLNVWYLCNAGEHDLVLIETSGREGEKRSISSCSCEMWEGEPMNGCWLDNSKRVFVA